MLINTKFTSSRTWFLHVRTHKIDQIAEKIDNEAIYFRNTWLHKSTISPPHNTPNACFPWTSFLLSFSRQTTEIQFLKITHEIPPIPNNLPFTFWNHISTRNSPNRLKIGTFFFLLIAVAILTERASAGDWGLRLPSGK